MGKGTIYPRIRRIIRNTYKEGKILEVGAGISPYKDLFIDRFHLRTDLPGSKYAVGEEVDVYCDARFLPFNKGAFGFIFGVAVYYLVENPDLAFVSAWQSLAQRGVFLVIDYTEEMQINAFRRHLANGSVRFFNKWNVKELRRLLLHSGFSRITRIKYYPTWALCFRKLTSKQINWVIFKARK